jgi:elongation factor G
MKKYETTHLRNVAIIAHGKAGKTTLAEAMLFDGGASDRLGRVDDGNQAQLDPQLIFQPPGLEQT